MRSPGVKGKLLYLVLLRGSTGLICIDSIQAKTINHKIRICFPKLAVAHSGMHSVFFSEDNPVSCGT